MNTPSLQFLICLALATPLQLMAAEVNVAVASNFTQPMKRIAQDFERETGHKATLSFGGTGQFYAQIRNGAPFAILLSADDETPQKLEQEGLAVRGSRFTYAIGKLVLWSKRPGFVDARGDILGKGAFNKIAIANPKVAPYGAAAFETLDKLGLRDSIMPKIVEGSSIMKTLHYVSSQNAQLGFVAMSQVFENGQLKEGSAWVVPSAMHTPIRQEAVLLSAGKDNAAATALLKYLQGERAKAVIQSFGYDAPGQPN